MSEQISGRPRPGTILGVVLLLSPPLYVLTVPLVIGAAVQLSGAHIESLAWIEWYFAPYGLLLKWEPLRGPLGSYYTFWVFGVFKVPLG